MMQLTLLSSTEKKVMAVSWIEVETSVGNFVIQPEHASTILLVLANQPITACLSNGKQETFMTSGGILHVERKALTLILNE